MAIRIVGVDLPQNKRGEVALTYIYGIGRSAANTILEKAEVDKNIKVKDWTDDQAARIREIISTEFSSFRGATEYQTTDGYWLLSRYPPPYRFTRTRTKYQE